ncbi:hypothetical protein BSYN_26160 [Bacteroides sedimenti]|uniref:Glycoside hydrolase family 92 protein n=1 Tax=Bacteroides sedimenti TaxID=2136147 RepID=A0ABM8IJB3_9BACE
MTQYVNPYIGTAGHGHAFLGANVPFGLVQLGPNNYTRGWDWCSGYHYSDSIVTGFGHMHLSGTGIGDLGDISLMPAIGQVTTKQSAPEQYLSGLGSLYHHATEKVRPGYYAVHLDRYNVNVELTATQRCGFHKYTFPASSDAKVVINLESGIGWDNPMETYITSETDSTISGYRFSKGWANDQRIYFHATFSKPFKNFIVSDTTALKPGRTLKARRAYGVASFSTKANEVIMVKVAISPVSIENAKANMKAELAGWNFKQTISKADEAWNRELNKVVIKADDATRMRTFYTALYHTMIAPSLFCDVNKDYRGADKNTHKNATFTNYTTFSLWDTYRAAHPLFTILQPERSADFVNTMLAIYQQQGELPVWHLMGNETYCMVGCPAVTVIADAYLKGLKGIDKKLAYEAMKKTMMQDGRGLKYVKQYGYIPADSTVESVAMGLEYAIADWSLGQVAKREAFTEDYNYFDKRGKYYRNYFDAQTGFARGRVNDNTWRTPFNPFSSIHRQNDYTEGNGWQYTWLVPQNVEGLIGLYGGEKAFTKKLDSLFIAKGDLGAEASPDISGLIGQYAHGNEPSHHITYMYAYVGQPWKTADKVREIMNTLYADKFDGLCGNEDVGQMSAWYVFSAMGFYPVNPSNGCFVFGSPVINNATISVGNNKTFTLNVINNSSANRYIQRMTLNGKTYSKSYIQYKDIMNGGKLVIEMGAKPSSWGTAPADRPRSEM